MFTALKRTVDATTEPVTRTEAKAHARITATDEDTLIDSLIKSARQACERYAGRSFITQTWKAAFPSIQGDKLALPYPTVLSITSVQYKDSAGDLQTVSSSDYEFDGLSDRPSVRFTTLPSFSASYLNPLQVTYTAGFGPLAADVPDDIKLAIKATVNDWFYNRDTQELPRGVKAILNHYHPFEL